MRLLTEGELQATVGPRPRPTGVSDEMWERVEAYVAGIPDVDRQGHRLADLGVPQAYAMGGSRWVHVLVQTGDRRVGLVVVLDLTDRVVHGHRLLDLRTGKGT